ncbi:GNAT family N-acetyltransferase [Photobacterium sp. OFAV2-7]|uniref:GNAT family N-acetyltransferase n=1 Tax=Photobacterium sp. OFAV2-7 TaxID=2917748 RepID=UPI001EF5D883|nr:GNAT family N-acetyltransferase [Photobacterium sp. OFAV2-7]MCG7588467.1 GNAT family N-acetyltransferase [Photobacterium sp. OFAV2-7]
MDSHTPTSRTITQLPTIETSRLFLRPVSKSDLDLYRKLLSCPITTRYLPGGKPFDDDYIKSYLANRVKHWEQGFGTFAIFSKAEPGIKLGYAGVEQTTTPDCSDIRYGITLEENGKGYALEAAKAVLDFTFGLGLHHKIYGVAVIDNHASVKILKRLGMKEENAVRLYDSDDLVTLSISAS